LRHSFQALLQCPSHCFQRKRLDCSREPVVIAVSRQCLEPKRDILDPPWHLEEASLDIVASHSAVPENVGAFGFAAASVAATWQKQAVASEAASTDYPADLAAGSSKTFVVVVVVVAAAVIVAAAAATLTQLSVAFDVAFVPMTAAPDHLCSHNTSSPCR